jgi:hypothetical protein
VRTNIGAAGIAVAGLINAMLPAPWTLQSFLAESDTQMSCTVSLSANCTASVEPRVVTTFTTLSG